MYRSPSGFVLRNVRFHSSGKPISTILGKTPTSSGASVLRKPPSPSPVSFRNGIIPGKPSTDNLRINSPSSVGRPAHGRVSRAFEATSTPPNDEARRLHIQMLTEQRKVERLTREASLGKDIPGAEKYFSLDLKTPRPDLKSRIDALTAKRRAERLTSESMQQERSPNISWREPLSDWEPRNRRPKKRADPPRIPVRNRSTENTSRHRDFSRVRPGSKSTPAADKIRLSASNSSEAGDPTSTDTWNVALNDDNWEPEVARPEFTNVEVPFHTDGEVFPQSTSGTAGFLMKPGISKSLRSLPRRSIRLRETKGGDYSRLILASASSTVVDLGPVGHAQFVLARQKDVPTGSRNDALAIISASTNKPSTVVV